MNEEMDIQDSSPDYLGHDTEAVEFSDSVSASANEDGHIEVYASEADQFESPMPIAIEWDGETFNLDGDSTQEEAVEETTETEYTDNEILFQINENIVGATSVHIALVGIVIGFLSAVELLKIWLQS